MPATAAGGKRMRTSARGFAATVVAVMTVTTLSGVPAAHGAAGGPKRGGSITYAIEAETTGGFCLPASQLAAGGIEVITAIYDTLVTINTKGDLVPYLAQSVTPNATFDTWTIRLRPGIKFHNGEALDANAVKLNLDTYRGANPKIGAPLNTFVFKPITSVTVSDPLTVVVQMSSPWPAFEGYLFGTGRVGMVAPAQLADMSTCATNMIGTGPFKLVEWVPNDHLTVQRNPSYWRPGLPYLDRIKFVPAQDAQSQLNGLTGGTFDVIQTRSEQNILAMRDKKSSGSITEMDTDRGSEVGYGLLNDAKPPFNDRLARLAVAYAGDANELNQIRNKGLETIATGPFAPGTPYYLSFPEAKASGFPHHDLAKAKAYAKQWSAAHGGQQLSYEITTATDPSLLALTELVREFNARAGINVSIKQVDQATLINLALSGNFQQATWENHPQGDPDGLYVWFHSKSPVNFSGISDPVIDSDLEQGRVTTDPAKRVQIYRDMNRRFASQVYELWTWYQHWGVGAQTNIGGLNGVPLPDGHGQPFSLYAGVVPTVGLYKR
jgi:peptide/nickel transport system substrate-binding protein